MWTTYVVTTEDGTEVLIFANGTSHAAETAKSKGFVPVRILNKRTHQAFVRRPLR